MNNALVELAPTTNNNDPSTHNRLVRAGIVVGAALIGAGLVKIGIDHGVFTDLIPNIVPHNAFDPSTVSDQ